jgi:hypothetical protein
LADLHIRLVNASPVKAEANAFRIFSPQQKMLSGKLVALLKEQAKIYGIEPTLIAPTSEIKRFASQYPSRSEHFNFLKGAIPSKPGC